MTMTTREPISIENGRVEIHTPENRVWLTRHQIADLFGVFVPAVGSNIRSILKSGIL
ncbi:protein-tyrosine kinase, partial [Bacteroides ovatus]